MSEKNLGSVVGLTLKNHFRNEPVTSNLDEKGRIIINADPIVSGYIYLQLEVTKAAKTDTIPLYKINDDAIVGFITLMTNEPDGSASSSLSCIIPVPFNYAISADGITAAIIHENGQILN